MPCLKLDAERKIAKPYVCIAAQSTNLTKYWNSGYDWTDVVTHLKSAGIAESGLNLPFYDDGFTNFIDVLDVQCNNIQARQGLALAQRYVMTA